jgi:hypothetical protein
MFYLRPFEETGVKNRTDGFDKLESAYPSFVFGWPAADLRYIVGQTVIPDSFDPSPRNSCSHGIHGFLNVEDAIDFG